MNLSVLGGIRTLFDTSRVVVREKRNWDGTVPGSDDPEWFTMSSGHGAVAWAMNSLNAVRGEIEKALKIEPGGGAFPMLSKSAHYNDGILLGAVVLRGVVVLADRSETNTQCDVYVVAMGLDVRVGAMAGSAANFLGTLPAIMQTGFEIKQGKVRHVCHFDRLQHIYIENLFARMPTGTASAPTSGAALAALQREIRRLRHLRTFVLNGVGAYEGGRGNHVAVAVQPDGDFVHAVLSGEAFHPEARVAVLGVCNAGLTMAHMQHIKDARGHWMPHMRTFSAACNPLLGDSGCTAVLAMCTIADRETAVTTLSLQDCGMTGANHSFVSRLTGSSIHALDLSCNPLANADFWHDLGIFNCARNTGHLHTLDVSHTGVSLAHFEALTQAPAAARPPEKMRPFEDPLNVATLGRLLLIAAHNPVAHNTVVLSIVAGVLAGLTTIEKDKLGQDVRREITSTQTHAEAVALCKRVIAAGEAKMAANRASWLEFHTLLRHLARFVNMTNFPEVYTADVSPLVPLAIMSRPLHQNHVAISVLLPPHVAKNAAVIENPIIQNHLVDGGAIAVMPWDAGASLLVLGCLLDGTALYTKTTQRLISDNWTVPKSGVIVLDGVDLQRHTALPTVLKGRRRVDIMCGRDDLGVALAVSTGAAEVRIYADQIVPHVPDSPAATPEPEKAKETRSATPPPRPVITLSPESGPPPVVEVAVAPPSTVVDLTDLDQTFMDFLSIGGDSELPPPDLPDVAVPIPETLGLGEPERIVSAPKEPVTRRLVAGSPSDLYPLLEEEEAEPPQPAPVQEAAVPDIAAVLREPPAIIRQPRRGGNLAASLAQAPEPEYPPPVEEEEEEFVVIDPKRFKKATDVEYEEEVPKTLGPVTQQVVEEIVPREEFDIGALLALHQPAQFDILDEENRDVDRFEIVPSRPEPVSLSSGSSLSLGSSIDERLLASEQEERSALFTNETPYDRLILEGFEALSATYGE